MKRTSTPSKTKSPLREPKSTVPNDASRLKHVRVTNLFGMFNHNVPLNTVERVTIIHGPNGYGKTIILRMVEGLLTGNHAVFRKVPFDEFELTFMDGHTLALRRTVEGAGGRSGEVNLTVRLADSAGNRLHEEPLSSRADREVIQMIVERIEHYVPYVTRVGPTQWLDQRTGDRLSLEDVMEVYGDFGARNLRFSEEHPQKPKWLADLRRAVSVRLVDTQRLQTNEIENPRERPALRRTVETHASDLAKRIREVLAEYAARAQELDRTFPNRLLSRTNTPVLSPDQLREKLASLEAKRERLTKLGFLDREQAPEPAPADAVKDRADVLSIYVADMEQKLGVFDEMAAKIELLTGTINKDRFKFKNLVISREQGFCLTSDVGAPLQPGDLSSGEQHELVLLYELLFRLKRNALVLIDEPEISLHLAWQERVLSDLQGIVKLSGVDIVVATHSAEIIHNRWDLTVALQAPATPGSA
jgi:predicted ATP-binding protein involved in virulence